MEEAPENGKKLLHSKHANGMNEMYNLSLYRLKLYILTSSLYYRYIKHQY